MNRFLTPDVSDLVALGRRARWALAFRLVLALSPFLAWWALPGARTGTLEDLLPAGVVYCTAIVLTELVRRLGRRAALWSIAAALLMDGVYLTWCLRLTGGLDGLMGDLLVIHAMAITLLASFRSGVKIAAWDSLLLVCVLEADTGGTLGTPLLGPSFPTPQLAALLAVIWTATFTTAAFAAVNERELRRRRYDMAVLRQFSITLEECYDLEAIATALAVLGRDELLARRVLVLLDPTLSDAPAGPDATHDPRDGCATLVCATAGGVRSATPPPELHPRSVVRRAVGTHEAVLEHSPDPVGDRWMEELMPAARNIVVVPCHVRGQGQGAAILEYGSTPGGWLRARGIEHRLLATAEQATAHAALAADRAYLMHRLRTAAETDGLTRIANRRTFDSVLAEELRRPPGGQEPGCSVILIDLDHFKSINDRHGHLVGDQVLIALADCLRTSARQGDIPARYGGEEFAMVLPGTGPDEALAVAERLRAAVEAMEGPVPVTASLGVASSPGHGTDAATLLSAADAALYVAKTAGRNRAVPAGAPVPQSVGPSA